MGTVAIRYRNPPGIPPGSITVTDSMICAAALAVSFGDQTRLKRGAERGGPIGINQAEIARRD